MAAFIRVARRRISGGAAIGAKLGPNTWLLLPATIVVLVQDNGGSTIKTGIVGHFSSDDPRTNQEQIQGFIVDCDARALLWTPPFATCLIPNLQLFRCMSMFRFTPSVFLDFVRSRVRENRHFELVMYAATPVPHDDFVAELRFLQRRGEIWFSMETCEAVDDFQEPFLSVFSARKLYEEGVGNILPSSSDVDAFDPNHTDQPVGCLSIEMRNSVMISIIALEEICSPVALLTRTGESIFLGTRRVGPSRTSNTQPKKPQT
ncbi:hypothetical protein C8R47DRAFT_1220150 [Mycena vitilis]|nr:hypothetical protein C8R47DRAFT_1220150 [Mycena vitilis]